MRRHLLTWALGLTATALAGASSSAVLAQGCANPNALGVARTIEIDTTGGAGFGAEHFNQHDFLKNGEVVMTFDDGPWPQTTASVLAALDQHCTKAIFFAIGQHATWHPEILKEVAARGHTIGSHTWSHKNLAKLPVDKATDEIEMGISAVRRAVGDAGVAFFRFPNLQHPTEMVKYTGQRNLGIWSTDIDSFDFKFTKASDKLVPSLMAKLSKRGKGIVLMHDFQKSTANSIPDLLNQLKAGGYKVVHVKAKGMLASKPEYDAKVVASLKGPASVMTSDRPTSSVVREIATEPTTAAAPSAKK